MTTAQTQSTGQQKKKPGFVDRWWHARIWHGFRFMPWMRLLARNGFVVGPHRISAAVIITMMSVMHSSLALVQGVVYGRKIRNTKIQRQPIFIIGHWRSGTTYLHELLSLDERYAYATNYECFAPHHFLLTEKIIGRWMGFLLPKQRPMDNMAVGWSRPQEDEFALCAMGQLSPYLTLAFPNRPPQCQEYLDMQGVPAKRVESWKNTLLRFIRLLTFAHDGKRIVLKSPPHTARVKILLELFPEAKFIHIVRDPYVLFQSTMNMWKRMYETQHLRRPNLEGLDEHVFRTFNRMYEAFEASRESIPERQLYEVRYEDLVQDPQGQVKAMYDKLELGEFENLLPALNEYLAEVGDYKTNRYELPPQLCAEIQKRWAPFIQRYGYADVESASAAAE